MKAKKNKRYEVIIDMKWSDWKPVFAKNKAEAKKKAWANFIKRVPKQLFEICVDEP